MKLKDTREEYYFYSGKVSEIVRQLGLSGIAVIWLFKIEISGKASVPKALIPASILLLLGLATDLFHYAAGTIIWNKFNRAKEIELEKMRKSEKAQGRIYNPEEEDFTAPLSINKLTKTLFWAKIVLIVLAYIFLIGFLIAQILVGA